MFTLITLVVSLVLVVKLINIGHARGFLGSVPYTGAIGLWFILALSNLLLVHLVYSAFLFLLLTFEVLDRHDSIYNRHGK